MQMLFLICIILSRGDDPDIVISSSWCIRANKAELWGILDQFHRVVNENPRISTCLFNHGWFSEVILKSAQQMNPKVSISQGDW